MVFGIASLNLSVGTRFYLLDKNRFWIFGGIIHCQIVPDNGFEERFKVRILTDVCKFYIDYWIFLACRNSPFLHSAHGMSVVILPLRLIVFRGAILNGSVILNQAGKIRCQMSGIHSIISRSKLGIREILNSFLV